MPPGGATFPPRVLMLSAPLAAGPFGRCPSPGAGKPQAHRRGDAVSAKGDATCVELFAPARLQTEVPPRTWEAVSAGSGASLDSNPSLCFSFLLLYKVG